MHHNRASLVEGSIWQSMLLFALPVFLGNVFQQFYNAFDSWVVGKFIGDTALAAVSSSGSLIFMMVGFFNGVAMGAGVIIARFFGARDYTGLKQAIHTDIALGLASGAVLTVAGVALTPTILRCMGTPEEVLPQSISYFRYYSWGILFTVMYNIFVGILHAVGDSRHPLYYLIFSTFVNVVLDLLFVAVFHWGVGSAAVATTISQGVSALMCFVYLVRAKDLPYQLHWRRRAEFRDCPGQCGGAEQHQRLRCGGHGRLRRLLQAGGLRLPAHHLLCPGPEHLCGAESGRPSL